MQETINALLAAVGILIMTQITQFLRSVTNRKRIEALAMDTEAARAENETHRQKIEQDTQALLNRVATESLDRIDRLLIRLDQEREEHKIERAEWREDRDEWKQERKERDERERVMGEQVESLKRELEAVRHELKAVREESSERETVIKEQSKVIDEQAKTISRHEKTITQQAERITALETQVAELEKLRREASAKTTTTPLPSQPDTLGYDLLKEARRKLATDQLPKVTPPDDSTGDDAA